MAEKNKEAERVMAAATMSADWKLWGPYVSERAWGTVREDYSPDGSAWNYFPFEHAHLKAYRWNEDGIAGICDRRQTLCFAPAFWNERDPIIKERFFGLAGNVGNHGEDVKEYYFYLDNTPSHSYMKFLYKYPQREFPYREIYDENSRRTKADDEFELIDTGIFDDNAYFDIFIEYAKEDVDDIYIRIKAINRGGEAAPLHILPTLWYRNTWSWTPGSEVPAIGAADDAMVAKFQPDTLSGLYSLAAAQPADMLFCRNETNGPALAGEGDGVPQAKDGIGRFVMTGNETAVSRETGTKAAFHYRIEIPPGGSHELYFRLSDAASDGRPRAVDAEKAKRVFELRRAEADTFYDGIIPPIVEGDEKRIARQAFAGMLWSKQFYHYTVRDWLDGDPAYPPPPEERHNGRNRNWRHLYNADVISMPDTWEYPWYAAWDLAFHCIPLAMIDPAFAKRQLILLLREWYMHPNGQIPAYEWAFSDVNPPVHAWAALRVYQIEAKQTGVRDHTFLKRVFQKLLLNFTWWVNRKDAQDNNVFEGGFLGLDNIGVFDRSKPLPGGGYIEQSDGTSWMAMYCLNMLAIAIELAREDSSFEDVATKFFEHFVYISEAMNHLGADGTDMWNEEDGFYYDVLHTRDGHIPMKLRSLVGIIPLFAVETIDQTRLEKLPDFVRRTRWFLEHRSDLTNSIACLQQPGRKNRRLLALVNPERLRRVLTRVFDEDEFLSQFGIRSLSKVYEKEPYRFEMAGEIYEVEYEPSESRSGMFGGNSNWRGPIWFPTNYLLIEALQKFDFYFGDDFKIEFPTGSGRELTLWQISQELESRLITIFRRQNGRRPVFGSYEKMQADEHWRDLNLFFEYFDAETGKGLGASHQTGWTGLIAKLIKQTNEYGDPTQKDAVEPSGGEQVK